MVLPDSTGRLCRPWGTSVNYLRIAIATAALAAASFGSTGTAFAWGCIAVSETGKYGYSYNFDNQDDATERALDECAARATTEETCEITECVEGS